MREGEVYLIIVKKAPFLMGAFLKCGVGGQPDYLSSIIRFAATVSLVFRWEM